MAEPQPESRRVQNRACLHGCRSFTRKHENLMVRESCGRMVKKLIQPCSI